MAGPEVDMRHALMQQLEHTASPGRRLRFLAKTALWRASLAFAYAAKRTLDVAFASIGLLLLSPVFATTAAAIYLEDRGPVFFRQQRVGRYGRVFPFYKFRSMVTNAESIKEQLTAQNESQDGVTFKMKRDPRITRTGAFIRRFSIDELPQLFNVLTGDMSMVGPRPPVPREVAQYTLEERKRLSVIPGITCIWQVSGRSDIPFKQQVQLDFQYIQSQSIWLDLKLLLRTVSAVLTGRGAY